MTYTFKNQCSYDVWLGEFNGNDAIGTKPTSDTWEINAGAAATVCLPQDWNSGRFWPRTGCTGTGDTLNCTTGQCGAVGEGKADCTAAKQTPVSPVTLFEVTTNADGTANFDISLVNGYNTPIGISVAGSCQNNTPTCRTDLLDTCPAALQHTVPPQTAKTAIPCGTSDGATTYCTSGKCADSQCVVGCFDPSDACLQNSQSVAALMCNEAVAGATGKDCAGKPVSAVAYLDMYLAKDYSGTDAKGNQYSGDNDSMASGNQGTPTCFRDQDCPPVAPDCVTTGFPAGYVPPSTAGVCFDLGKPGVDNSWANNTVITCSSSTVNQACGGMVTVGFTDGLGYTCQPVTYTQTGGRKQTAYACLPPLTEGLGTCKSAEGSSFYPGVGGVMNASWMKAAAQAGANGKPFYEIFTDACEGYGWQYDDIAADFGCTSATGFTITFCPS